MASLTISVTLNRRAAAPAPEDHAVVAGSQGPRRDLRTSVGLREGWDAERRMFDVSEAGQPALSGMFICAEVTYAWPQRDGAVGSDREPVAVPSGEAVQAYVGHLPDAAIEAMLNELAAELGAALGQERIDVAFAEQTWILDVGERESGD